MKYLLLPLLFLLVHTADLHAQYVNDQSYHYTYRFKLSSVNSPADLKLVSLDLKALFDSSSHLYSVSDSVITVRSGVDISVADINMKLTSYGYTVTYLAKIPDPVITNEK